MASNSFVFLIVFLVVTFVMYKAASGHSNIVENWGWTMTAMNSQVNSTTNGAATYGNNQEQLYFNPNQFINPSLLNEKQQSIISQTVSPTIGVSQASADGSAPSGPSEAEKAAASFENYQGPNPGIPVYTVPGTYQADLSPRFNSVGLNSFVKYNLPQQEYLASYAQDPLTMEHPVQQENYQPMDMVNMVERPLVREDYKSAPKQEQQSSEKTYRQMNQKLADMGAQVTDKLPVQPMNGSHGSEKEPIYYNADRYIFAMQKSRLYGRADFIRGDIPVVPTLPNADINSNVWFRPSVTPRTDLNAGALGVIGGTYNTTQQQLLEIMARSAGGSMSTINGVQAKPVNTPVNVVKTNMNSQISQLVSQSTNNSPTSQTSGPAGAMSVSQDISTSGGV